MDDSDSERLRAEVDRLRTERDAALEQVRHLSRVNEREWAEHVELSGRAARAEAQVRAIEELCRAPVTYVVVTALRAALIKAARPSWVDRPLPEAS
jgi:hypothetical protein